MGALFELLAQLIVAAMVAGLAQLGLGVDGSAAGVRQEPPSVQRTLFQAAPAKVAGQDCPEDAGLHAA